MKYSVTGRKFSGSLRFPVENVTDTEEYDDRETAEYYAVALSKLGYRVWLYEQQQVALTSPQRWKRIAEWSNGGVRLT